MRGMLEKQNFRPAVNKLENDLRNSIKKWLKDEYEAAANEHSKDEALEVVNDVLNRWETLAEQAESGNKGQEGRQNNRS